MKEIIKKLLPLEFKSFVKEKKIYIESFFVKSPYSRDLKSKKKFIIFSTPTHGNLGDHAIVKAQRDFLKRHHPDYFIIEIPTEAVFSKIHHLKKITKKTDLIFLHGGGNLGDLYIWEEIARRHVIKTFKKFPIIQFPQSATFTSKSSVVKEMKTSKQIYSNKGKLLTIIARESKSYQKFQEIFDKNNILYTPDIVLTLNERRSEERKGILLCLRNDSEKVISLENQQLMMEKLKIKYENVTLTDTIVNYNVFKNTREQELQKKWDEYRQSKMVITDRLHGMIFAVITGTPCIVFDNFNQKVQKTYLDWLSDYKNIRFVDVLNKFSISNILQIIDEIEDGEVPPFKIDGKYDSLLKEIRKNIL